MFSFFNRKTVYRPSLYEIPTLDQSGLEIEWLYTKDELIRTDCFKSDVNWATICSRAYQILPRLLAPYGNIFDPAQIQFSEYLKYSDSLGELVFKDNGSFEDEFGHDGSIAMSYYLYCGWIVRSNQRIFSDRNWIRKTVDHLIDDKEPLAFLLKGIILKHGFTFPSPPDLIASRKYLLEAEAYGIAEAKVELISFGRYMSLAEIRPANTISEVWK